eukprot:TRINITY_DN12292_c0_g1_i1.p1 TRINITY_DN12292_c0_g1~~TRINITY_DN12292_c0_g1_i1.p1  ORF type:complete len:503 (+),score=74.64 TRINITY_DN12292_c0_g1_i1:460-1968(+)
MNLITIDGLVHYFCNQTILFCVELKRKLLLIWLKIVIDSSEKDVFFFPCRLKETIQADTMNAVRKTDFNDKRCGSAQDQIKYCIRVWFYSLGNALVITIPVVLILWVYFLPGLILRSDILESCGDLIYVKLRKAMIWFTLFGFSSAYGVQVFGIYFWKRSMLYCLLPGFSVVVFVDVFLSEFLSVCVYIFVTITSIYLIWKEKAYTNAPCHILEESTRKNELVYPIAKMTAVIWMIYFLLQYSYPIFLDSGLRGKLFIRVIILPILNTSCTSLQLHIVKSVRKNHTEYLIPMIWVSSGFLTIYERIIANTMFKSGDYLNFIFVSFASSVIEIINHLTYFYRIEFMGKILTTLSKLGTKNSRSVRMVSVNPSDHSRSKDQIQLPEQTDDKEWLMMIRTKMILEDIAMEVMMTFTVTFLLYFIHPLIKDQKVETIPSFEIAFNRLLIQMSFEFLSDFTGIYWTVRMQGMKYAFHTAKVIQKWFWVWVQFIAWQSLLVFWFFISF